MVNYNIAFWNYECPLYEPVKRPCVINKVCQSKIPDNTQSIVSYPSIIELILNRNTIWLKYRFTETIFDQISIRSNHHLVDISLHRKMIKGIDVKSKHDPQSGNYMEASSFRCSKGNAEENGRFSRQDLLVINLKQLIDTSQH